MRCRYVAIVDLTRRLNSKFGSAEATRLRTQGILRSLFPPWLPAAFKVCPLQAAWQGGLSRNGNRAGRRSCSPSRCRAFPAA